MSIQRNEPLLGSRPLGASTQQAIPSERADALAQRFEAQGKSPPRSSVSIDADGRFTTTTKDDSGITVKEKKQTPPRDQKVIDQGIGDQTEITFPGGTALELKNTGDRAIEVSQPFRDGRVSGKVTGVVTEEGRVTVKGEAVTGPLKVKAEHDLKNPNTDAPKTRVDLEVKQGIKVNDNISITGSVSKPVLPEDRADDGPPTVKVGAFGKWDF